MTELPTAPPPRVPRVIVADDDRAFRNLLAVSLALRGVDVLTATDGSELGEYLDCCPTDYFDVVVTDVHMPGHRGTELLWRYGQERPFVLVTAFADDAVRGAGARYGAREVLEKSMSMDELCEHIVSTIERARGLRPTLAPLRAPG